MVLIEFPFAVQSIKDQEFRSGENIAGGPEKVIPSFAIMSDR
jgi:hypothetical protein